MPYSVKIDKKGQLRKLERAFERANKEDLQEAIVGEIISPVWDWSGTTYRRNGEVVGSPRNLVDEGTLLEGYKEPRMQGKNVCVHPFEADHTLAAHNGAVLRNGGVIQPRRFTDRPLENFPAMFAKRYREDGG